MNKRSVQITIGTETYNCRWNYDALTQIEDLTGKSYAEVIFSLRKMDLRSVRAILFTGMKQNHPDLQLAEVGEIMDGCDDITALILKLSEVLDTFFSKSKKKLTDLQETSTSATVA